MLKQQREWLQLSISELYRKISVYSETQIGPLSSDDKEILERVKTQLRVTKHKKMQALLEEKKKETAEIRDIQKPMAFVNKSSHVFTEEQSKI